MRNKILSPLAGTRFGSLTVVTAKIKPDRHGSLVQVKCLHGRTRHIYLYNLASGRSKSCQRWKECSIPAPRTRFEQLTVTEAKPQVRRGWTFVEVECLHGKRKFVCANHLKQRNTLSCRNWRECFIPKIGQQFGTLTVIDNRQYSRSARRCSVQVRCSHGVKKRVAVRILRAGYTKGCRIWRECCVPTIGRKFGALTVVSNRIKKRQIAGYTRTFVQVRCSHGVKKYVSSTALKIGDTGCGRWKECGLTRNQHNHVRYIRERTPKVNLRELAEAQRGCIVCGGVRAGRLDSLEHIVPVRHFARSRYRSLKNKNARANSEINIGVSHRSCNMSKNRRTLVEYWKLHPDLEFPAKVALSGHLCRFSEVAQRNTPSILLLLKQTGCYVRSDSQAT